MPSNRSGLSTYRDEFPDGLGNDESSADQLSLFTEQRSEEIKNRFKHEAVPSAIAQGKWNKIVVWGLGGTLLDWSQDIVNMMAASTVNALRRCKVAVKPEDEAEVIALAKKSYAETGVNSTLVAKKYDIPENTLLTEIMVDVVNQIAVAPAKYGLGNQGDLNMFEDSINNQGHLHMVLTTSPGFFATRVLHWHGLAYLMHGIMGCDSFQLPDGAVANKREHGDLMLKALLRDVPDNRLGDVIVVDHGANYLNAAQNLGCSVVNLDRRFKNDDTAAQTVRSVFEKVLGVKFRTESREKFLYDPDTPRARA